ncbi:hypothetical protein TNCV_1726261 [Trichonephila clavipes]|nr:hypothetical protein TNCV_1726261 [Trichonephila clavipes]
MPIAPRNTSNVLPESHPYSASNECTRQETGRKGKILQDSCRLFAWKFFQTQQKDHVQAKTPLPAYVAEIFMPNSDPVQMFRLSDDLCRPS